MYNGQKLFKFEIKKDFSVYFHIDQINKFLSLSQSNKINFLVKQCNGISIKDLAHIMKRLSIEMQIVTNKQPIYNSRINLNRYMYRPSQRY